MTDCNCEIRQYGFVPVAKHPDRTDIELRLDVAVVAGKLPAPILGGKVALVPQHVRDREQQRIDVV